MWREGELYMYRGRKDRIRACTDSERQDGECMDVVHV